MRPALARAILAGKLTREDLHLYAWLANLPRVPFGFFVIEVDIASAELLWADDEVESSLRELQEAGVLGYARDTALWFFM